MQTLIIVQFSDDEFPPPELFGVVLLVELEGMLQLVVLLVLPEGGAGGVGGVGGTVEFELLQLAFPAGGGGGGVGVLLQEAFPELLLALLRDPDCVFKLSG